MADPSPVDKAFLIAAIQHEHELMSAALTHERELRESSQASVSEALRKQAHEYERRLDELNHAHAKANEDKQAFLLKVTYEAFTKEFDTWKLEIVERFASDAARQAASGKLWAIVSSVVTALVTAGVLWATRSGPTP